AEFGEKAKTGNALANVLVLFVGLAMLVVGARMFVNASIAIAQALGVSELVIGLTIVAAGTSLPEVATSVVATIRGERDIAIGNVVGSNIYNVLVVLGATSFIKPIDVPPQAIAFDIPVMIAVSFACLPIFFTGLAISRWEGAMFLAYYAAYTAFVIMHSRGGGVPPAFTTAMVYFFLPLTAVTLCVLAGWEFRARRTRTS
ncbi:MAG: sodium:calcium antiporter, partial [Candidatus Hydrogenedentes bacterium]|nr:sodium:calcium antiporter [Candidatus Hydrogenedentota bacterium]